MKSKKPNLHSKSGKFWLELNKGKSKKEAALSVGLNPKNVGHVMETNNFQALEQSSFKEEIIKHILMSEIAREHVKVIEQDKDLGSKMTAIKLAYEKIEPEGTVDKAPDKVLIILR